MGKRTFDGRVNKLKCPGTNCTLLDGARRSKRFFDTKDVVDSRTKEYAINREQKVNCNYKCRVETVTNVTGRTREFVMCTSCSGRAAHAGVILTTSVS